jgi:hypothetical protein
MGVAWSVARSNLARMDAAAQKGGVDNCMRSRVTESQVVVCRQELRRASFDTILLWAYSSVG